MKKITLLFILFNFFSIFAQKEIKGVVSDATNSPLVGVNIIEKGTKNAVSTDTDGRYKIKTAENATLIFSYIGFDTKELKVTNENTINVVLT